MSRLLSYLCLLAAVATLALSTDPSSGSPPRLIPVGHYSDGIDTVALGYSLPPAIAVAAQRLNSARVAPLPLAITSGISAGGPTEIKASAASDEIIVLQFVERTSDKPDSRAVWNAGVHKALGDLQSHIVAPKNNKIQAQAATSDQDFVSSAAAVAAARVLHISPGRGLVVVGVSRDTQVRGSDATMSAADALVDLMPPNTKLYRPPVADESNSHQATLTSLAADYAARAANYQRGVDIAQAIVRKFDSKNGQQLTGVTAVDARVQTLVKNITTAELKADVEYLSGEATGSPLTSRHSLAKGHVDAAKWVKAKYESYGCKTVELVSFRDTYGPNVVCTIPGTDLAQEHVVLGAHLDDRGSQFTASARAPGANDDGSGSSMLLASLRHLKESGFRLRRTVKVVNFCGEEQGLIGSKAYAQAAKKRGDKIVFMLQGDMLAYRVPGEPLQCALPAAHASPDASAVVSQVARAYVPEVVVGQTSACCSDHQSFYEQGFVSTQIYERNGPIADPFYHNKGDLARRSGYDYEQLQGLARIALATIVTVAEIDDTVTPK